MASAKPNQAAAPKQYIALKLPLDPNKAQLALFAKCAGTARWAYNWAIAQCKKSYADGAKHPSAYTLQKKITILKRQPETEWLQEVSNCIPREAVVNADRAFRNFFSGLKSGRKFGFPKFKCKGRCRDSFHFNVERKAVYGRRLSVPRVGRVRISRRHFTVPEGGRPIRLTISRQADKWYASILYEVPAVTFTPNGLPSIGVDLGLTTFATLSTGEAIKSERPLRIAMRRLKRAQRRLSKAQKGSNRRNRKRTIVGRIHARVANIRQTFIHALTARLSKNHGQVVIEDLAVRNLMANRHLAFAIGDQGWGEFRRQLEYKCPKYGSQLIVADRFFPSSKTCSACGHVVESLPLSVREWTCQCGAVHDRDVNAAINLKQIGRNTPESKRVESGEQDGSNAAPVPLVEA